MSYQLNDQQRSNALLFLDRVQIQGLKENQAMYELIMALSHPVQEPIIEDVE